MHWRSPATCARDFQPSLSLGWPVTLHARAVWEMSAPMIQSTGDGAPASGCRTSPSSSMPSQGDWRHGNGRSKRNTPPASCRSNGCRRPMNRARNRLDLMTAFRSRKSIGSASGRCATRTSSSTATSVVSASSCSAIPTNTGSTHRVRFSFRSVTRMRCCRGPKTRRSRPTSDGTAAI